MSVVKHWTVFVYGTLKKGEPNHHWLSNTQHGFQEFVGAARMVKRFPLVIASRYNVPYLLDLADEGHYVEGEVYRVDCSMLAKLDELEDHPKYYRRREEAVQMVHDGQGRTILYVDPYKYIFTYCTVYGSLQVSLVGWGDGGILAVA
jgi:gamma-glutamylaminecyclotransferase